LGYAYAVGWMWNFIFVVGLSEPTWQMREIPERSLVECRWVTTQNELSTIHFNYDIRSGDLVEKFPTDRARHIVATPPGTHLWSPHPETRRTLEDFFADALRPLDIHFSVPRTITRGAHGAWTLPNFEDQFSDSAFERSRRSKNLAELISETEQQVAETRKKVLAPLDFPGLRSTRDALLEHDVIEPLATKISHEETRFDAFVLFPLKTFEKYGDSLLDALFELANAGPRYPLEWLMESRVRYNFDVRISILMALTHNHLLESLLIEAVAIQRGIPEAWKVARALNEIYINEREFWNHHNELRKNSGSPEEMINVEAKNLLHNVSSSHEEWLSSAKLYHFYGAVVFAARSRKAGWIPDRLLVSAAESVGVVYKLKTLGFASRELQKMKALYRAGAMQILQIGEAID
jgi:hypothetical protein